MKKILKYILVFGLPAVVCGIIWILGVARLLDGNDGNIASRFSAGELPFTLYACGACFSAALILGVAFRGRWLRSTWPRLLGWAALHEICGATLFGTFLVPIAGTVAGFILAFPLMPVQILGSLSQIRLFRYLHNRFLTPQTAG